MQEKLEATLAKLIAIPSESDNRQACHDIIEFCRGELEPLGLHMTANMDSDHPWLMATTQQTKSPKILLVAHLDVVPASDDNQFEMRIDGEKLYGRGTWDMKYAAAAYLEFLKANAEQLPEFDLGILLTTDEEVGSYQGTGEVIREGWRTQLAFIPDFNDDWKIEEAAKGYYSVKLHTTGYSAHGSRPWEGENAIQKLIPILHELQTIYPNDDPHAPTLSVTMTQGGQTMNQIPDAAYAWIDFRAFKIQELEDYKSLLGRMAAEQNFRVEETMSGFPHILDKEHPLVKEYAKALQEVGIKPEYKKSFGGTDAHWFAEFGIPCIVTGPHGENAHGPAEWVDRRGLNTLYSILEQFIPQSARLEAALDEALETAHTA